VENLQCRKGTEQEGPGRAPNHQDQPPRPNELSAYIYHPKVVDNTILSSYYHTSRSHVEIKKICVEILPYLVPQKDDIDFSRIFSWENK
jgi:hypothetical protein